MKSLYESILSKSGVGLEEKVRNWYPATNNSNFIEKIEFTKNGVVITADSPGRSVQNYIVINDSDLVNGDFPFKIDKILSGNGEEKLLVMRECGIKTFKNFPNHKKIRFSGCSIEDLSRLPKSYKDVEFFHSNSLSGGHTNYIANCQGLKLDSWISDGNGYALAINMFKNNTIKDFCLCTVSWNDKVNLGNIITRIVDDNHIDPKDITVMFYNEYKHHKVNRGRVEKKKVNGEIEYVVVKDANRHPEIRNGYIA